MHLNSPVANRGSIKISGVKVADIDVSNVQTPTPNACAAFRQRTVSPFDPTDFDASGQVLADRHLDARWACAVAHSVPLAGVGTFRIRVRDVPGSLEGGAPWPASVDGEALGSRAPPRRQRLSLLAVNAPEMQAWTLDVDER